MHSIAVRPTQCSEMTRTLNGLGGSGARLDAIGDDAAVKEAGRAIPAVVWPRVDVQREQVLPQPQPRAVAALTARMRRHRLFSQCFSSEPKLLFVFEERPVLALVSFAF